MASVIEATPDLGRRIEDCADEISEHRELLRRNVSESGTGVDEICPRILVLVGRLSYFLTDEIPAHLFAERHYADAAKVSAIDNACLELYGFIYSMKHWRPVHPGMLSAVEKLVDAITGELDAAGPGV